MRKILFSLLIVGILPISNASAKCSAIIGQDLDYSWGPDWVTMAGTGGVLPTVDTTESTTVSLQNSFLALVSPIIYSVDGVKYLIRDYDRSETHMAIKLLSFQASIGQGIMLNSFYDALETILAAEGSFEKLDKDLINSLLVELEQDSKESERLKVSSRVCNSYGVYGYDEFIKDFAVEYLKVYASTKLSVPSTSLVDFLAEEISVGELRSSYSSIDNAYDFSNLRLSSLWKKEFAVIGDNPNPEILKIREVLKAKLTNQEKLVSYFNQVATQVQSYVESQISHVESRFKAQLHPAYDYYLMNVVVDEIAVKDKFNTKGLTLESVLQRKFQSALATYAKRLESTIERIDEYEQRYITPDEKSVKYYLDKISRRFEGAYLNLDEIILVGLPKVLEVDGDLSANKESFLYLNREMQILGSYLKAGYMPVKTSFSKDDYATVLPSINFEIENCSDVYVSGGSDYNRVTIGHGYRNAFLIPFKSLDSFFDSKGNSYNWTIECSWVEASSTSREIDWTSRRLIQNSFGEIERSPIEMIYRSKGAHGFPGFENFEFFQGKIR
ncbi:MAG: hypothetical protein VX642_13740 [Bdellovibrionota bacterium]|nr:hypothetical protein [Bdellovibrionota bacterium]